MSCERAFSEEQKIPVTTLPTCVMDVSGGSEKRKRDVDLWFTCYTLPVVVHSSPVYRSGSSFCLKLDVMAKLYGENGVFVFKLNHVNMMAVFIIAKN